MKEVCDVAYQYSEKNKLVMHSPVSTRQQGPGHYWFTGFMQHHPKLRIRKHEALSSAALSSAWAMSMNNLQVDRWFTEYENLLKTLRIKDNPSHIWNCGFGLQSAA